MDALFRKDKLLEYLDMTKLQLLKLISGHPDNMPVLIPAGDHSYRAADVSVDSAIFYPRQHQFEEDHGDENIEEGGRRIAAIIVS